MSIEDYKNERIKRGLAPGVRRKYTESEMREMADHLDKAIWDEILARFERYCYSCGHVVDSGTHTLVGLTCTECWKKPTTELADRFCTFCRRPLDKQQLLQEGVENNEYHACGECWEKIQELQEQVRDSEDQIMRLTKQLLGVVPRTEVRASKRRPTEAMLKFFEKHNLEAPRSSQGCRRLRAYIWYGNDTVGGDPAERVGIIRSLQQKWLHKRVRTRKGVEGVVTYLLPLSRYQVEELKEMHQTERLHPVQAMVHTDEGRTTSYFLSSLEIIG